MANSDYAKGGTGSFAIAAKLAAPLSRTDTEVLCVEFNIARAISEDMAVMIGDEIMAITNIGAPILAVKRGCADTIPALHAEGADVWIFGVGEVGSDYKEYSAGETLSAKVLPYTVADAMEIERVPPDSLTFNWRFARPYPPAQLMVNGARWFEHPAINDTTQALHMTWVHRDRVVQSNKLVGHDDASVGPEPGVTYTVRIYGADGTLLREEVGIVGSFTYQRAQALHDFGMPEETTAGLFMLSAQRDAFESWQRYTGSFSLVPDYPLDSNYMAFERRVIESPYALNSMRGVLPSDNFVFTVAARPSDRMSDSFAVFADDVLAAGNIKYVPWVTCDFRLPELETIINVRDSSFFDGVPLGSLVGKMAMIDNEIVLVVEDKRSQIVVRRGCCDTIPAPHVAGSRVWFFWTTGGAFDTHARTAGDVLAYKARPKLYGDDIDLDDLPATVVTIRERSSAPYPPGQVVVNNRPWFEEVQATAGLPVFFSWVRRNRVTQSAEILSHIDDDVEPEFDQATRLRFFYELGGEVILRDVLVSGTAYSYSYALALADGYTAGRALGICGTVLIYCKISAVRNGPRSFESVQSYIVPIRVPSYACEVM